MASESSSSNLKLCGICNEQESKYCCPKCETLYCSLNCYKSEKHITCSENFYRDMVNENMFLYAPDEDSENAMKEILKRMYEANNSEGYDDEFVESMEGVDGVDSDDELEPDLHQRLLGLNLDDPNVIWNALTNDERNEFEAIVNEGDVGALIPLWEPWWQTFNDEKITELFDESNKEKELVEKCPAILKVPKLGELTSAQPSAAVMYNIANVIASYAFVMRYFNGEMDPVEGAIYLFNVCANLDNNANFNNIITAVNSVNQRCLQSELITTDEESLDVMRYDTFRLLQGPSTEKRSFYCKAALSHLHSVLTQAKIAVKNAKTDNKIKDEVNETDSTKKENEINEKSEELDCKSQSLKDDILLSSDESKGNKEHNGKDKKAKDFTKRFPDHKLEHLPKLDLSKMRKCIKKIEYYLSFVEDHDEC